MNMRQIMDRLNAIENETDSEFLRKLNNEKTLKQLKKWEQEIEDDECKGRTVRDKKSEILDMFDKDPEAARHLLDKEHEKARLYLIRNAEKRRR